MRLADLWSAASFVTTLRLVVAVTAPFWASWSTAWLVYLAAITSDVLDGLIARRTGTETRAGAAYDAWVDKILHVNLGWALAVADRIPDPWLLAWCARELIQGPLVPVLVRRFRLAASPPNRTSFAGRLTAFALSTAVLLTLLERPALLPTVVAGVAGAWAGLAYARRHLFPGAASPAPSLEVPVERDGRAA